MYKVKEVKNFITKEKANQLVAQRTNNGSDRWQLKAESLSSMVDFLVLSSPLFPLSPIARPYLA